MREIQLLTAIDTPAVPAGCVSVRALDLVAAEGHLAGHGGRVHPDAVLRRLARPRRHGDDGALVPAVAAEYPVHCHPHRVADLRPDVHRAAPVPVRLRCPPSPHGTYGGGGTPRKTLGPCAQG